MAYTAQLVMKNDANDETEKQKWRETLQEHLEPYGQPAPRAFADEDAREFKRRTVPLLQARAPGWENKRIDASGETFDLLVNQVLDASNRELKSPTRVPDGELKEMRRVDSAGRPYFEFYGKCGTWMKDFATDKKKLMGIRTENQTGYTNPNVSSIAGLKY